MSLIHCSPLFHPLEPLPVMGPAAMRSADKVRFLDGGQKTVSAGGPATSSRKGKKAAMVQRPTQSPASTALSTPSTARSPYSVRQPPFADFTMTHHAGSSTAQTPNHEVTQQSYQDNLFDSQNSGHLTFTTESQPMDDLSSSQQVLDQNH